MEDPIRKDTAKHIKKIRLILRAHGYLKRRVKPISEAQQVKLEGRY